MCEDCKGRLSTRQVALHLRSNEAANHRSATWLRTHNHRKQVEIDHVAQREQLPRPGSSSSAS